MNYQAVLFDMDGVIVDSEQLHNAAFHATLKNYGYHLTSEEYKQHFTGRTDEAGLEQYFNFINETVDFPTVLKEKAKAYLDLAADQLVAYSGVLPFIHDLVKRNIALALVTGALRVEAEVTLKAFDLTDVFSVVITAEDISHSKPNPEGYLKGAKALDVDPAACILIEDAPSGIQAAKDAGMLCVAVTNTHTRGELKDASFIVDQLLPGSINSIINN